MDDIVSTKDGRSYKVSINKLKNKNYWLLFVRETRRHFDANNSKEPYKNWLKVCRSEQEALEAKNSFIATGEFE